MKIVFMGTPDFAVPSLESIYKAGHEVGIVVTQPDTARDRGKKLKHTKVKEKALELGLKVSQPQKVKGNMEFLEELREYNPDVIVVVAYGKILPKEILETPQKACINVHGSLLPKLRGAAPIQRAILEGHKKTGITIMEMGEGLDTGDMLLKKEVEISRESTGELFEKLSLIGGELIVEALENIDNLLREKEKQNDDESTYAAMIFKEEGRVDFAKTAIEVDNHIRGMTPMPGAFSMYKGEKVKLFSPEVLTEDGVGIEPGKIVRVDKEGLVVATKDKLVAIKEIQFPGKKKMAVKDYIVGNRIDEGLLLM